MLKFLEKELNGSEQGLAGSKFNYFFLHVHVRYRLTFSFVVVRLKITQIKVIRNKQDKTQRVKRDNRI